MTVMNSLNVSVARLNQFLDCALPAQVAMSTIKADIEYVSHELGFTSFWRPRLACAWRMLDQHRAAEAVAVINYRVTKRRRK